MKHLLDFLNKIIKVKVTPIINPACLLSGLDVTVRITNTKMKVTTISTRMAIRYSNAILLFLKINTSFAAKLVVLKKPTSKIDAKREPRSWNRTYFQNLSNVYGVIKQRQMIQLD